MSHPPQLGPGFCAYKDTILGRKLRCIGSLLVGRGYFVSEPRDLYACRQHAAQRQRVGAGQVVFVEVHPGRSE
jgi:hypothetical protein